MDDQRDASSEPADVEPLGISSADGVARLPDTQAEPAGVREPSPSPLRAWRIVFVALFGVALPTVALGVELAGRMCRNEFFDPLPTWFHVCLVALVPILLGLLLLPVSAQWPRLSRVAIGITLTVTLVYSLMFLPLTPLAAIAIVFYGIGLLALAPLLAFAATVLALGIVVKRSVVTPPGKTHPIWVGVGAATMLFILPMIQPWLIQRYILRATSDNPRDAADAIVHLRNAGAESTLLRICTPNYGRHQEASLLLAFAYSDISSDTAANLYYRVTGNRCVSTLTESDGGFLGGRAGLESVAADTEGFTPSMRSLTLSDSRIDGTFDAKAALGYVEWTWVLHNDGYGSEEARAEVTLPEGSAVSRATLWVNGEPQEAAFAERNQVKQAYERVVSRRRDPLLVTWLRPNRIELRCFPVPSKGDMKLRIGFTSPLRVLDERQAVLALPRIDYRNFALEKPHQLWVEAKSGFRMNQHSARQEGALYRLNVALSAMDLRQPGAHLAFLLPGIPEFRWSPDPLEANQVVTQRFEAKKAASPARVIVVVDASQGQVAAVQALAAAIVDFPNGTDLSVLVAGDEVRELRASSPLQQDQKVELERQLKALSIVGGADNAAALYEALLRATAQNGTHVLWVHGAQTVQLSSIERLEQMLERGNPATVLLELSTGPGRNLIVDGLADQRSFVSIVPSVGVTLALRHLFQTWGGRPEYLAQRVRQTEGDVPFSVEARTSDHLVRLWAAERIEQLAAARQRDEAVKIAAARKLVTSVSGAVVLENAQQYKDAGLNPPGQDAVPSVPEPGVTMVILGAFLSLAAYSWFLGRKRSCT